jgi:uncharacterized membrane protein
VMPKACHHNFTHVSVVWCVVTDVGCPVAACLALSGRAFAWSEKNKR